MRRAMSSSRKGRELTGGTVTESREPASFT